MELEGGVLVSPTAEVPVIEGDVVTAIRTLAGRGVGKKTIAREVGVAVNTSVDGIVEATYSFQGSGTLTYPS